MQEVGNGHALKKGMMPDLRTIDHLPISFGAKKKLNFSFDFDAQNDIIPFRPGAPASASAAFSFSHIRSQIVWLFFFLQKKAQRSFSIKCKQKWSKL